MASGRLTTHVLDQAAGKPAAGLKIALYRLDGETPTLVSSTVTNDDGRTDAPMASGDSFTIGGYELVFDAGDYLRRAGHVSGEILFLDRIPIRFGIADASQHFHVPLLLSPYGYATYKGS
ncbi:hydroxyisourate hydrolase [Nisaea sp.]|uniref:hydroxyisourate hydrolase n=1 Tax=Nisaea sp. TaxID=2024842 RepID=UPI003B5213E3